MTDNAGTLPHDDKAQEAAHRLDARSPENKPKNGADHPAPVETEVLLRILATTDLHGSLRGYDYTADKASPGTGLSRIASLITAARRETPNNLLFDNGDFLQGSLLVDFWGQRRGIGPHEVHPMIAAMNALGYDAGTLGNHEFNFGLEYLTRVLSDAKFPFVSANASLRNARDEKTALLPRWTILHRILADTSGRPCHLRIGVIGFLPPQTANWDRMRLENRVETHGIIDAARAQVPLLRAAGADIVIALAHTGIDPMAIAGEAETEHAATQLAAVDGIDALICGHSHLLFPVPGTQATPEVDPDRGLIHGKPAVLPGRWGSHLGVMDLRLCRKAGAWHLDGALSQVRPVSRRTGPEQIEGLADEAADLVTLAAPAHEEILSELSRTISHSTAPLHSFFSMVAPDAALGLIAAAKIAHVQHAIAHQDFAGLPVLAAVTPIKCGARGGPDYFVDIPAGPLRMRHILDMYAFPNLMTAVRLTGAQVTDWLERAAGAFERIIPGIADQPLLNPVFPAYNFDIMYGLRYEIDLIDPARYAPDGTLINPHAHRIRNLTRDGRPVLPDDEFIVATNSFRAAGTGCYPAKVQMQIPLGPEISAWDMLQEAARRHPRLRPRAHPVWKFSRIPGASAWFDTSPHARGRLHEAQGARLEEIGLDPEGFLKVRYLF